MAQASITPCGDFMRNFSMVLVLLFSSCDVAIAQAGSSYLTSDGLNRAPASVLHCVGANNVAVPCGTSGQPVYVTGNGGLATSSNQTLQVQADQAIAAATGTQQDPPYSTGAGSVVAILKGLINTLAGGTTAFPLAGMPISRSVALTPAASTAVFPSNALRHYLAFQAPINTFIWVNFVGGAAAPNGLDCVQFSAGTLYESSQVVTKGVVNIYSPTAVNIAAWED